MRSEYVTYLRTLFARADIEVVHYPDPARFIEEIAQHVDDVVFSLWHGSGSRNQVALVPAICESYGVRYIGADAHARIVCEDKEITRDFARRMGFDVPYAQVIRHVDQASAIASPDGPVVIKPVSGGMSAGVELYTPGSEAGSLATVVRRALVRLGQPILVEQYVPGREVMIPIVGTPEDLRLYKACEVFKRDEPDYFFYHIFSAELKQTMSSRDWVLRAIDDELDPRVHELCRRTFRELGIIHYLRIDGRWDGRHFWFLELSPTAHLNRMSALSAAATLSGLSIERVVRLLFDLASIR
jgi:D-alanine-D-alanine ligase